jgi:hypothetical protein
MLGRNFAGPLPLAIPGRMVKKLEYGRHKSSSEYPGVTRGVASP